MKVRCNNCNCVVDAAGDYIDAYRVDGTIRPGWWKVPVRCTHCGGYDVTKTDEPYRPPKRKRITAAAHGQ